MRRLRRRSLWGELNPVDMQPQINSIEYQLTPALRDKLVLEESEFRIGKHKWRTPILFGLLVAVFVLWLNYPLQSVLIIGTLNLSTIAKIICASFLMAIGFFIGLFVALNFRKRIRSLTLEAHRKFYEKLGSSRKILWDDAVLTVIYPTWETKIKWQIVDKVVQGKVGVYLFVFDQPHFSIPKESLPSNISADELISAWSGFICQSSPTVTKP